MTPAEHIQAIEDAAAEYAWACADVNTRAVNGEPVARAWKTLQTAIIAGVGAAPPKDSAEFALAALVAAGHVSQSKADEARALMPEGGDVPKAAPEGWQLVPVEPTEDMRLAMATHGVKHLEWAGDVYAAMLAAAPKPYPTASLRTVSNQRTVSHDLPVQQHYF